jgi:hypothetical protein
MDQSHVIQEVELLREKIIEFGTKQPSGEIGIQFGELYEKTVDIFEVCMIYVNAMYWVY